MGVPTRVFSSETTRRSAWKDPNDPLFGSFPIFEVRGPPPLPDSGSGGGSDLTEGRGCGGSDLTEGEGCPLFGSGLHNSGKQVLPPPYTHPRC